MVLCTMETHEKERERYIDTNSFWLYNQAGSGTHERITKRKKDEQVESGPREKRKENSNFCWQSFC